MTTEFERPHPIFLNRLDRSDQGNTLIAAWLRRRRPGNEVTIKPHGAAPTRTEAKLYRDHGDMILHVPTDDGGVRDIQIGGKWLGYNFTTTWWPFRTYFIGSKESFDAIEPKPEFIFSLSADLAAVACVDVAATRAEWRWKKTWDKRADPESEEGLPQETYYCDPGLVAFYPYNGEAR